MDRAQAGLGQADPGQQGGQGHALPTGGGLGTRLVPGQQTVPHRGQSRQGQGVGDGIGPRREIRLQQLGQGIHAVGSDQVRRTGGQQVGIDDGVFGHQGLVAKGLLETLRTLAGEHGVLGRLRTRPGGGGHGDEGRGRSTVGQFGSHPFQVIHDRVAGPEQAGDGLGGIQHAAAADADHQVPVPLPLVSDDGIDPFRRGFSGNVQ